MKKDNFCFKQYHPTDRPHFLANTEFSTHVNAFSIITQSIIKALPQNHQVITLPISLEPFKKLFTQ